MTLSGLLQAPLGSTGLTGGMLLAAAGVCAAGLLGAWLVRLLVRVLSTDDQDRSALTKTLLRLLDVGMALLVAQGVLRVLGWDVRAAMDLTLFRLGQHPVTPGAIVTFAIVLLVTAVVSRAVRGALTRGMSQGGVADAGIAMLVGRLAHYLLVALGTVVALDTVGIDLATVMTWGAAFAVGLSLALQSLAQSFVAGVLLILERSIKPGDILLVEGEVVRVQRIGVRSTVVRTRWDEELLVPNSRLVEQTVRNFTLSDTRLRVRITVGLAYTCDLARSRAALQQAGALVAGPSPVQEPVVLLVDFADSSVLWEVSVWTEDPWGDRVLASRMREVVWEVLAEHGLEIAFPQLDVHLRPDKPEGATA